MNDPQPWNAMIEIHQQGVVVGTLLGGFAMASAFSSFSSEWKSSVQKYTSIASLVSAVFFICVVCISSLVLFIYSDIEYLTFHEIADPNRDAMFYLAIANFILGSIAMSSLFLMLALLGWEKSTILGWITTACALIGVTVLVWAFWLTYVKFQVPVYGPGFVVPQS